MVNTQSISYSMALLECGHRIIPRIWWFIFTAVIGRV